MFEYEYIIQAVFYPLALGWMLAMVMHIISLIFNHE